MTPFMVPPGTPIASKPSEHVLSDEELLQAVLERGEDSSSKSSSFGLLLATAALFLGLGGLRWGWRTVVYVAIAVGFHEIGHVIAMRVCGYKNVRMLFIPLLGGLATGQPQELNATRNALVALAGPVFGLLTVLFAAMVAPFVNQPAWVMHFARVSLVLNAFNLIPLVPLDGGQFTNDVLFSRYPILELIFRLMAIVGLGWLAYHWHAWLLGLIVWFMLVTTGLAFRRARVVRDARKDPTWAIRPLDLETIAQLRVMVASVFVRMAPAKYQKALPVHVQRMWLEVRKRFPSPGRTVALMAGYLGCVVSVGLIALLLNFVQRHLAR